MKTQQEQYLELQTLNSEIQQIQQQLSNADKQIQELNKVDETLDDFSNAEEGSNALAALGNGIFAKMKLANTKEVIMSVGANVTVNKTLPEAKQVVIDQVKDMENLIVELEKQLGSKAAKMEKLQIELQALMEKNPQ